MALWYYVDVIHNNILLVDYFVKQHSLFQNLLEFLKIFFKSFNFLNDNIHLWYFQILKQNYLCFVLTCYVFIISRGMEIRERRNNNIIENNTAWWWLFYSNCPRSRRNNFRVHFLLQHCTQTAHSEYIIIYR